MPNVNMMNDQPINKIGVRKKTKIKNKKVETEKRMNEHEERLSDMLIKELNYLENKKKEKRRKVNK